MLRNNEVFLKKIEALRNDHQYSLAVGQQEVKAVLDELKRGAEEENKEILDLKIE